MGPMDPTWWINLACYYCDSQDAWGVRTIISAIAEGLETETPSQKSQLQSPWP